MTESLKRLAEVADERFSERGELSKKIADNLRDLQDLSCEWIKKGLVSL